MFLGIEIGGTKLQLGLGDADGIIASRWRGDVDMARGAAGIREQILREVPKLSANAELRAIGVGFGGPTDDATQTVIVSHQVHGWDGFPLASWLTEHFGVPAGIGNDADVAGLAEATYGAGKGLSPVFYITVGTGVGGGLIINGEIYRGVGRGAAEIGHLRIGHPTKPNDIQPLENYSSGGGIEAAFGNTLPAKAIAVAAANGDAVATAIFDVALQSLAEGICDVIALLCPKRIIIGGGVSLIGEERFFAPLRRLVAARVFAPFAGLTDIVPAALGEDVVIHGALALARKQWRPAKS